MDEHIIKMIEQGIIFGGILKEEDGIVIFERRPLEEIVNMPLNELAFATGSMGRAVFTIDEQKNITNIKGVDSHLKNDEISTSKLVGAEHIFVPNPNKSYEESIYPINLLIFPGNKVDIRIRGASPLEDLEIEAEINSKLKAMGIKVPQIESVREFSSKQSERLGLPIKVRGNYAEFESNYEEENNERKKHLHIMYGDKYFEEIIEGLRPEKMSEYLKRKGVIDLPQLVAFAIKHNFRVDDFVQYVDKSYQLGQRYGQTIRKMNNPFRISDIEYYTNLQDVDALNAIMDFSQSINDGTYTVEQEFATQMGKNLGLMMSNGWCCENFVHRQDYTLAGEMCDDSYFDLVKQLEKTERVNRNDLGKVQAVKSDYTRRFFSQIFLIGSNVKVLQDEMQIRGKNADEIEELLDIFSSSFTENFNIELLAQKFNVKSEDIIKYFEELIDTPRDFAGVMASSSRKDGTIKDEAILLSHNPFNEFYIKLGHKVAEKIKIKNDLLKSGIAMTEKTTKASTINEQAQTIRNIEEERNNPENDIGEYHE